MNANRFSGAPAAPRAWISLSGVLLALGLGVGGATASMAANAVPSCDDQTSATITIEMKVAKQRRPRIAEIKRELQSGPGSINARVEVTAMAAPPLNIGIGRCVDAAAARLAIRAAQTYNGGVDRLIFQEILPHRWIMIGTTQVAELSWTPVSPEELERLTDPSLSTEAFQTMYRTLATPKERKRPFGMGPVPAQPDAK